MAVSIQAMAYSREMLDKTYSSVSKLYIENVPFKHTLANDSQCSVLSHSSSSVISRRASQVEKPASMKRSRYSEIPSDCKMFSRWSIAKETSNRYAVLSVRSCIMLPL
jgi:hypothetical protein